MSKIFFVGSGKMCTTSVGNALEEAGLRVSHRSRYGLFSQLSEPDWEFFDTAEVFIDGFMHNVVNLDRWFPGSHFILLDRKPEQWMTSVYNWGMNLGPRRSPDDQVWLARINRVLSSGPVCQRILEDYLIYRRRVLHYFQGRENFLHVDIEAEGADGWKRLSEFLEIELEPTWVKRQSEKVVPEWIREAVSRAQAVAEAHTLEFPGPDRNALRHWAFQRATRYLAVTRTRHRFPVRNIKRTFREHGPLHWDTYRSSLGHLVQAARMFFYMALRAVSISDRRACPFRL